MIDLRLGDCLATLRGLPSESVHCCITSPPYFGLRDYGADGQIGLERTPDAYVAKMVKVFAEVRRVLRSDGTCWLNLGDSYSGGGKGNYGSGISTHGGTVTKHPNGNSFRYPGMCSKQLLMIPHRVALALQADGWIVRMDCVWHKPNPMPEAVKDRPTKAHEYLFLLSKSERYFYDHEAVKEKGVGSHPRGSSPKQHKRQFLSFKPEGEPTRNRRSVWTVPVATYRGAHFATFPPKLIEPCILAGCPVGGTVLDPFSGAGTTGVVAVQHGRSYLGIELNPAYLAMSRERIAAAQSPPLAVPA